jgi:hypothetical protein
MRRACFSIILYMTDSAIDVEGLSPLAPLATDSFFASKSGLFDMAKDTHVFRLMEPDGMTISFVFVAVNAKFETKSGPEDSKNALHQVCEVLVTSLIYGSLRGVTLDVTPIRWCQLFSPYGNMLNLHSIPRYLRSSTPMEASRGMIRRRENERQHR